MCVSQTFTIPHEVDYGVINDLDYNSLNLRVDFMLFSQVCFFLFCG